MQDAAMARIRALYGYVCVQLLLAATITSALYVRLPAGSDYDFHAPYGEPKSKERWQNRSLPRCHPWLPHPSDKHILVVPELKLLFCFIPKNACTQFNRLMNALNGITDKLGENCMPSDPMFASSVRYKMGANFSMTMMKDPSWTKAVFLRDPLERLVSAHRSKCEQHECGGCLDENFTKGVLEKLADNDNMHYLPQRNFCGDRSTGSLEQTIGDYDFVGHLSHDYKNVSSQVQEMLHLALRRKPGARLPALFGQSTGLGDSRTTPQRLVEQFFVPTSHTDWKDEYLSGFSSMRNNLFQRPLVEQVPKVLRKQYFPTDQATGPEGHNTGTKDRTARSYYHHTDALTKALDYYGRDYQVLPGLEVPSWAAGHMAC